MAVRTTYFRLCVNAPRASNTVALRCSRVTMKWQIGSGSVQTMLKYLLKLMLSITLSITRDLSVRPSRENSAVWKSKTKNAASVMSRSLSSSAPPMSALVCFFTIIATMSVPPEDAPMLNSTAELNAGSATAKSRSSMGWVVSGSWIGQISSITERETDKSRLEYTVLMPNERPKKQKPTTSSSRFTTRLTVLGPTGRTALTTTERPVTPPNVKLLGNLNRYVPSAIKSVLAVMSA